MKTSFRISLITSLLIGLSSHSVFAAEAPTPVEQFATLLSESANWSAFMTLPAFSKEKPSLQKQKNANGKEMSTSIKLAGKKKKMSVWMRGGANHPEAIELSVENVEVPLKSFLKQQLPTASSRVIADQCEAVGVNDGPTIFLELTLANGKKAFLERTESNYSSAHGQFNYDTYTLFLSRPVEQIKIEECKRVKP